MTSEDFQAFLDLLAEVIAEVEEELRWLDTSER